MSWIALLPITSYSSYRILRENASKDSDDTRTRKRRRLARGVQGRHAQDMSLITPDNVAQRPQWRITPLGRLIRPMRMRPARPLDPPLDPLRTKSVEKGGKTKTKKKKRARPPPTRARRQTIDPLRWGSTHLSGIFLDGNANAPPPPPPPRGSGPDGSAKGESTEVDEVEHILEVSDQTLSGDEQTVVAELDLAAERASALDLISAMFGEADTDWGGAENIDSDVEMAGVESDTPRAGPSSLPFDPRDLQVVPATHSPRASQKEEKKSTVDRQKGATPTPATTNSAQPSTQTKLKDLFAPREEEGESLAIYSLTSLITSPHPPNRFLPYRSPRSRSRLGARPRHGPAPGRTHLPKRRSSCSVGHVQSQRSISHCTYDTT